MPTSCLFSGSARYSTAALYICGTRPSGALWASPVAMGKPAMSGVKKNKKKGFKPSRGKTPGGRVYEVAQEILNAPEGGVAAVIAAALNDKEAPIRRDPRAFTMFSTRCRKKGEWSKCVEIFDAMRDQGVETNTIVYNATMSACSKGGDWERALELFETMPREGHDRSTITYNVAMSACMRGGDWERALELFDQMAEEGLERDHVSINTAMAAAEAGGQTERLKELTSGAGATGAPGGDIGGQNDDDDDEDEDIDQDDDDVDGRVDGGGAATANGSSNAVTKEKDADNRDDDRSDGEEGEKDPDIEEDPVVRERRLKAERRDARKRKFEEKRRARKAAKLARGWVTDNGEVPEDGPGAGRKRPAPAGPIVPTETAKKRKEWGSNPLKWVDEDEGLKKKGGGDDDSESDDVGDGLPPITGPSLLDAPDEEAGTLLNDRDDTDDFWATGF